MGHRAWTGTDENWLGGGTTMWWSHADADTNRSWLTAAGLVVEHEEFVPEGDGVTSMSGRDDWFETARVPAAEHPHDTEDLVRPVAFTRHERGLTEAQPTRAAGVPESEVRRFDTERIVPAEPPAMRFVGAMRAPRRS
jgi:hypothetical protein